LSEELEMLMREGRGLTEDEINSLEKKVQEQPDELPSKIKLLGYYGPKQFESTEARKARQKIILWIIQNCPELVLAGTPECYLEPSLDMESYFEAKKLWLEQVETNGNNPIIIGNAADFLLLNNRDIAKDLLEKAKKLEPNNPEWNKRIARFYELGRMRLESANEKQELAKKELAELESALEKSGGSDRFNLIESLSQASLQAGELEKARLYANELLNASSQDKSNWNYGNTVHYGNIILGQLALKAKNIEEAKLYLLKAGETPGSPQLNSFGPDMTLAKELLLANEKETVIKYLELCSKFWESDRTRLDEWVKQIAAGVMPDFGSNLHD